MNSNRKFRFSLVLALSALLMNAFAVMAYPADEPETGPVLSLTSAIPCRVVLENAQSAAAGIDIPSRRAEYAVLDRIANCMKLAGIETTIPITSPSASPAERFLNVKDRQAEQMDRSADAHDAADQRWMEFKDRQAERMDH